MTRLFTPVEQGGERTQTATALYGEPSAEAVAAQMPDLILISAPAGIRRWHCMISFPPSPRHYHQLRRQKLAVAVNAAWRNYGHEKQAAERIAQFDKQLAAAKSKSNYRRSRSLPLSIPPLPQCQSLDAGISTRADAGTTRFTLAKLPAGLNASQSQGKRQTSFSLVGKIWLLG